MKKVLLISTAVFGLTFAHGQTTFQRTFGGIGTDEGWGVRQTIDGGYIVAGRTWTFGAGGVDFYLIRTDSIGDTLWTKAIGGTLNEGSGGWYGISIRQTADGGFILASSTNSPPASNWDACLLKIDSTGTSQWMKTFGGSNFDNGFDVLQIANGNYIFAGRVSPGAGIVDACLIKTNTSGDTLWIKNYGGADIDQAYSVQQTPDGGYILAGSTLSFGAGNYDYYLIKTDSVGNILWTKTYGGANQDECFSVKLTNDGGYILCGQTYSFGAGDFDIGLIKTDGNGNLLWSKTYGGVTWDRAWDLEVTSDNGFIIAGATHYFGGIINTTSNALLIKTDSNGDTLWTMTYGGSLQDDGYFVQETMDGGYVLTGTTQSFGAGARDMYLIKTDANGNSNCFETPSNILVGNASPLISTGGIITTGAILDSIIPITSGTWTSDTSLCIMITGQENTILQSQINLYPNPFSTQTTLQADNLFHNATLTVYNYFGQTVKQFVISRNEFGTGSNSSSFVISRDNLPSGLYFVRLTEENNPDGYRGIAVDKLVITDK